MDEKLYKTVSAAGVWSLVMGIVTIVTGITTGVLLLVTSAKILKGRNGGII
jgi:hypothetical protein